MFDRGKPEAYPGRALAPLPGELPRPAVDAGEYYGRAAVRPAVSRSFWQTLWQRRWLALGTFLLILGGGMGLVLRQPRLYRASAEVLVAHAGAEGVRTGSSFAESVGALTTLRSVATEMKMLSSRDLLDEAFGTLTAGQRRAGFNTLTDRLSQYPVAVTNAKDTDILTVAVTARDPDAAAAFADGILTASITRRQATTRAVAEQATAHVRDELARTDAQLRATLDTLAKYKQAHRIVDVQTQTNADVTGLANLETSAAAAEVDRARAQITRETLERQLRATPEVIQGSKATADNPLVKTIDEEIERLQQERARKLQDFLPTAPEVQAVDAQIAEARTRKTAAMARRVETVTTIRNPVVDTLRQEYINALVLEREAQSRLAITRAQATQVKGRIAALPRDEERLALLNSKVAELQSTHAYLAGQQQALNLSLRGGVPNVLPITRARVSRVPVSPNVPMSAGLLFVLALGAAIGLVVLREGMDDRVHTPEMAEALAGRRVLTALPRVNGGFQGLVTDPACPASLLESFRILRGYVQYTQLDPLPQIVMVTSAQPGEGKSTTVANLAATMALGGKRTLVIDADLRHPSLHLRYGLPNTAGLSDVLRDAVSLEEAVQATTVDGLTILTAGTPTSHPPELLASPAMAALIDALRTQYDYLVLDSTPLLNLSDGPLIAVLAQGALVVVAAGRTRYPDLHAALRLLESIGTPVLGLVYNRDNETPALRWE
jgi:capsular exopolysaccharide synthesis family protein